MLKGDILNDLPRGAGLQEDMPQAHWRASDAIARDRDMRFAPENPGRKVFLGEVDGQLVGAPDDMKPLAWMLPDCA